METQMNDSDKDGVPDYLDQENNSVAGVAVDTKGRMVDKNNNGVPDELERYLTNNYSTKESTTIANAAHREQPGSGIAATALRFRGQRGRRFRFVRRCRLGTRA